MNHVSWIQPLLALTWHHRVEYPLYMSWASGPSSRETSMTCLMCMSSKLTLLTSFSCRLANVHVVLIWHHYKVLSVAVSLVAFRRNSLDYSFFNELILCKLISCLLLVLCLHIYLLIRLLISADIFHHETITARGGATLTKGGALAPGFQACFC